MSDFASLKRINEIQVLINSYPLLPDNMTMEQFRELLNEKTVLFEDLRHKMNLSFHNGKYELFHVVKEDLNG